MAINLSTHKIKSNDSSNTNPLDFFYELYHPEIKELSLIQADILKKWYADTENNDHLIPLNTGIGKTLIGLYIAESMRRKKDGKILYLCPTIQLVKQTVEKAKEYGLQPSYYYSSSWHGTESEFLKNESICITTYDAVFHSESIFKTKRRYEIKGCIFDDAHLSTELIQKQYSITFYKTNDESVISEIQAIFPEIEDDFIYEEKAGFFVKLIPPLLWSSKHQEISNIIERKFELKEEEVSSLSNKDTRIFQWNNIKNKLKQTLCFYRKDKIEISFLYPDVEEHYIFDKNISRIYLSATIFSEEDIIKNFKIKPLKIETDQSSYKPTRLFLLSKQLKDKDTTDDVIRQNLFALHDKILVLVPYKDNFKLYEGVANTEVGIESDDIDILIDNFKDSDKQILILAGRYDGIDFEKHTCNFLVLDGLPDFLNLKNKFFTEVLSNGHNILKQQIASRIIQALGRTVRSNNDFSIDLILNQKLNDWLLNKDNHIFLNSDLYSDLQIGIKLSEDLGTLDDIKNLLEQDWISYIKEHRHKFLKNNERNKAEKREDLALKEKAFSNNFLKSNFDICISMFDKRFEESLREFSEEFLGLYYTFISICYANLPNKADKVIEYSQKACRIKPNYVYNNLLDTSISSSQSNNILYCEDENIDLYKIAWLKIKDYNFNNSDYRAKFNSENLSFKISGAQGAPNLRVKLDQPSFDELQEQKLIGLFDFDEAGVNAFNGLADTKRWGNIQGDEKTGLYKIRNDYPNIIALLLPIPESRKTYASWDMFNDSKLEIELYFSDDVLKKHGHHEEVDIHDTRISQFKGTKVDFPKKIFDLDKNEFNNFKLLFIKIEDLFDKE